MYMKGYIQFYFELEFQQIVIIGLLVAMIIIVKLIFQGNGKACFRKTGDKTGQPGNFNQRSRKRSTRNKTSANKKSRKTCR